MSNSKIKRTFIDSFWINDRASCEQAIKNGGIAATISAGITALFAGFGIFTSSSNKVLAYMLDPWMVLDVVVIIVLSVFIFRKSRVASTLMVLYFVTAKALMWYEIGKPKGLIMSIIFFLFYVTAMRATYIWHTSYKGEPSPPVA